MPDGGGAAKTFWVSCLRVLGLRLLNNSNDCALCRADLRGLVLLRFRVDLILGLVLVLIDIAGCGVASDSELKHDDAAVSRASSSLSSR